ncbi:MAG TPA: Gfo/Idh/MocA family oxidoreductase, partial [Opitutaceae bacterium]|nr:Gfo/Idh/MocA family oxidoreductase [Opitutaceae bacterium]
MKTALKKSQLLSRRDFFRTAAGTAAVLSVPLIIPSRLFGANAPSNRLRIGQIGCGRIAQGHDMPGVLKSNLADIVAVCDLDSKRVLDGKALVERFQREKNAPISEIGTYHDYRELIARKDIDALVVSTPDHWHAELALAAIYAGKDVYLQKPMTMTVAEGILLRKAVADTGRILQVGSQQRSTSQF